MDQRLGGDVACARAGQSDAWTGCGRGAEADADGEADWHRTQDRVVWSRRDPTGHHYLCLVAGNGSGALPDGFGQYLSSLQDSIDSLRANMRAASDETAVMDQTDSVQVITSALTQATEEIERARDALRALDEIVAP